ncbi:MAG: histone deacetylase family protein [Pseudomonadota bacterium]
MLQTIYPPDHALHDPQVELADGKVVPAVEVPARVNMVHKGLQSEGLGSIQGPEPLDRSLVERVHRADYVEFIETFWDLWLASGRDPATHDVFPFVWPASGLKGRRPRHIDGLMGFYSFDAGTPMGPGTWAAVQASAACAQTGANRLLSSDGPVFALCRPPGHHAMPSGYGGYCFLNNAAIAAQSLRDAGAQKVAILDVDYHHGNGTQAIFEAQRDVLFVSIHADPRDEYPYFSGYADEFGIGEGEGSTLNLPLPFGTDWVSYRSALGHALTTVRHFGPDALIISLGVDTFYDDPISHFALQCDDFVRMGADLASLKLPTLFVFEGGYAVEALAGNTLGVLKGFLDA